MRLTAIAVRALARTRAAQDELREGHVQKKKKKNLWGLCVIF